MLNEVARSVARGGTNFTQEPWSGQQIPVSFDGKELRSERHMEVESVLRRIELELSDARHPVGVWLLHARSLEVLELGHLGHKSIRR